MQAQLWHRDGDDVLPSTYAPETHPIGSRRELPERDKRGRSDDEQMSSIVPGDRWLVCAGVAGTIVLADTCGYHKQLKPESEERLVLVLQDTSGTPNYPSSLQVRGADEAALGDDQRAAVRRS